jgi:hypothetical protein
VERKIGSGKKCVLSPSAALKKQTTGRTAKSYRELGQKIQVHHNTVKKYLTKIEVHCKAQESPPKTTTRQQSVIKARLKLLTQKNFSAESIYKCVTVDGNEWQQQINYESEDHPATEDVKFIRKTKFLAMVL